jgi:hypothetical protein
VVDRNGYFVVRSTGYAAGNTVVTVEALMKPMPWPAIVTNGDLLFAGSPDVLGDGGSVHANGSVTVQNPACTIAKDVTAVGDVNTPGGWTPSSGIAEGGQLPINIPPVNVADYTALATYRLGSDGGIYHMSTGVQICASNADCGAKGFDWTSSAGADVSHMAGITRTWDINGLHNCAALAANGIPDCGEGVYYAQASDVTISGNIGRVGAYQPFHMTLLVDGSIRITGTPVLAPPVALRPKVLFVTNGDLRMAGTANCVLTGQARVREQFELGGTMSLAGQILVENRYDTSDEVHVNMMYGSATVTNDRLAVYDFGVAGWREFRR